MNAQAPASPPSQSNRVLNTTVAVVEKLQHHLNRTYVWLTYGDGIDVSLPIGKFRFDQLTPGTFVTLTTSASRGSKHILNICSPPAQQDTPLLRGYARYYDKAQRGWAIKVRAQRRLLIWKGGNLRRNQVVLFEPRFGKDGIEVHRMVKANNQPMASYALTDRGTAQATQLPTGLVDLLADSFGVNSVLDPCLSAHHSRHPMPNASVAYADQSYLRLEERHITTEYTMNHPEAHSLRDDQTFQDQLTEGLVSAFFFRPEDGPKINWMRNQVREIDRMGLRRKLVFVYERPALMTEHSVLGSTHTKLLNHRIFPMSSIHMLEHPCLIRYHGPTGMQQKRSHLVVIQVDTGQAQGSVPRVSTNSTIFHNDFDSKSHTLQLRGYATHAVRALIHRSDERHDDILASVSTQSLATHEVHPMHREYKPLLFTFDTASQAEGFSAALSTSSYPVFNAPLHDFYCSSSAYTLISDTHIRSTDLYALLQAEFAYPVLPNVYRFVTRLSEGELIRRLCQSHFNFRSLMQGSEQIPLDSSASEPPQPISQSLLVTIRGIYPFAPRKAVLKMIKDRFDHSSPTITSEKGETVVRLVATESQVFLPHLQTRLGALTITTSLPPTNSLEPSPNEPSPYSIYEIMSAISHDVVSDISQRDLTNTSQGHRRRNKQRYWPPNGETPISPPGEHKIPPPKPTPQTETDTDSKYTDDTLRLRTEMSHTHWEDYLNEDDDTCSTHSAPTSPRPHVPNHIHNPTPSNPDQTTQPDAFGQGQNTGRAPDQPAQEPAEDGAESHSDTEASQGGESDSSDLNHETTHTDDRIHEPQSTPTTTTTSTPSRVGHNHRPPDPSLPNTPELKQPKKKRRQ